jgi:phytoene dehydrogenase-like protein
VRYRRRVNEVDAVVIGAGPNGLVAANLLADAGWRVIVFEAQPEPGGAVRSAELTHPGYVHDVFSAFYPLGFASPVMQALDLEANGVHWRRAPITLAHPQHDGRCAVLSTDLDETAKSLESYAAGDGGAWRSMYADFERVSSSLLESMTSPIPPVRGATRLALKLGPRGLFDFTRQALVSVRRLAAENFAGEGAALLLTGNALHSDVSPDSAPSGFLGWVLTCLGQQFGFPVPEGGAGQLTAALVRRLEARGDAGGSLEGTWSDSETEAFADRIEAEIESHAPGFRSLVTARHLLPPPALEARDENLVGGALGGGTMAFSQQLVFRPIPGLGRAETPVRGLFLASASAHPGGGVHGACGANAARAALAAHRIRRLTRRSAG